MEDALPKDIVTCSVSFWMRSGRISFKDSICGIVSNKIRLVAHDREIT